jgi:hypothetical protein
LFRSHILGCSTVISMDPSLNRYILLNEGRGLIPGYPQSMLRCVSIDVDEDEPFFRSND